MNHGAVASKLALSFLVTLPLSACVLGDPEDIDDSGEYDDFDLDEAIGETTQEVLTSNGMSINGMSINGMSINGMSINGMSINGMSINGMSINGSQLSGVKSNGTAISGTGFVGASMTGTLTSGGAVSLRVDSAQLLPAPNNDVWAYGMSYQLAGTTTWSPMCGSSATLAVPLSGTWNLGSGVVGGGSWTNSSTKFTFGCRGAALAKCVELGYKPWKIVNGVSLRNHHQACVRMIRADYCGDGKPWTQDGTPINIYDSLNIQTDAAEFKLDAEWVPAGARCIYKLRDFQVNKPSCEMMKKLEGCGTFKNGALLINEYKP
jgi:ADYC domain